MENDSGEEEEIHITSVGVEHCSLHLFFVSTRTDWNRGLIWGLAETLERLILQPLSTSEDNQRGPTRWIPRIILECAQFVERR